MKTKKLLMSFALFAAGAAAAWAQKSVYIPYEWLNAKAVWGRDTLLYKEDDPDNKYTWSKSRSRENDNFIVLWQKGWGSTAPDQLPKSNYYYVDIDDLLKKADGFYDLYINRLKFVDEPTSNVSKHKMLICLVHDTEWLATGSGYDDTIGALWVTPSTCKPVGHTIAHEIGHSFQYQVYCDLGGHTGFRNPVGNANAFWEQTAQWQAANAHPELRWAESWSIFHRTANYAMTHEWHRYQSYWWHYYLAEKYGEDIVARIWRHDTGTDGDPNEALMDLLKIDSDELYRLYFDYAMKMATVDIAGLADEGIGQTAQTPYAYHYVPLGGTTYQVAYASTPQSTGFNVIPLAVPEAGTEVSTLFTALKYPTKRAAGDPGQYMDSNTVYSTKSGANYNQSNTYLRDRGWRIGYVALLANGQRVYISQDSVYCAETSNSADVTARITATVPEGTQRLCLVVSPAPRTYYQHKWDMNIGNDDQWPYTFTLEGTNILGAPILNPALPITDATITYDVALPYNGTDYTTTSVTLSDNALSTLGTAFQMLATDVDSHITPWTSAEPTDGQIKFYAVSQSTGNIVNANKNTNETYGHWFSAAGERIDWGASAALFSDFIPSTLTFNIGQYPAHLTVGKTYTIAQALKYCRGNETATVKLVFRVACTAAGTQAKSTLASVEQSPRVQEILTPVASPASTQGTPRPVAVHTLSGTRLAAPQTGVNIIRYSDGTVRKVLVK